MTIEERKKAEFLLLFFLEGYKGDRNKQAIVLKEFILKFGAFSDETSEKVIELLK